jgi:hypothetical protein
MSRLDILPSLQKLVMHRLLLIGDVSLIFYKIHFSDPSTLLSCNPLQKTFLKKLKKLISPSPKSVCASCREVLPLNGSRYYLLSFDERGVVVGVGQEHLP